MEIFELTTYIFGWWVWSLHRIITLHSKCNAVLKSFPAALTTGTSGVTNELALLQWTKSNILKF